MVNNGMRSIILRDKIFGELFNSFVELSWVLWDSVLHFESRVEGANDEVNFGARNACSSVFLNYVFNTFLR